MRRATGRRDAAGWWGLDGLVVVDVVVGMGVVVMATMVVLVPGEGRRYRQYEQGSEEKLLHAMNVAPR